MTYRHRVVLEIVGLAAGAPVTMAAFSGWRNQAKMGKMSKKYEEILLLSVPPGWSGPLLVMCVSFVIFALLWMLLAKRCTSRRILHKYKLVTALDGVTYSTTQIHSLIYIFIILINETYCTLLFARCLALALHSWCS